MDYDWGGDLAVGGDETPKERIDRLIREGKITREAVNRAEELWAGRLREGVRLPNRDMVTISKQDLYHVVVDERIHERPERIVEILKGVFEIRTTHSGRRVALSRWTEGERRLVGYAILNPDNSLQALHAVDEKRIRRFQRRGELVWES